MNKPNIFSENFIDKTLGVLLFLILLWASIYVSWCVSRWAHNRLHQEHTPVVQQSQTLVERINQLECRVSVLETNQTKH